MTVPNARLLAAVCRSGHIVAQDLDPPPASPPPRVASEPPAWVEGSSSLGSSEPPPRVLPRHCGRCGARVLRTCPSCDAFILGAVVLYSDYDDLERPESFCWDCGKPYPWATREERIGKLYDEIDHEDLDEATLLTVREQLAVLSAPVDEETDERRGQALDRLRGLVPKTYEALLPVLQGLATAEMKRRFDLQ